MLTVSVLAVHATTEKFLGRIACTQCIDVVTDVDRVCHADVVDVCVSVVLCVCVSMRVGHTSELCKNG